MTILIVDDNPRMRRTIKSVVQDMTTHCFECADGREALAVYDRQRPDWVLLDIKLSQGDGLAATRLLRAADPAARIIIVTTYDDVSLRAAAREAGACAYVLKENLLTLRNLISG